MRSRTELVTVKLEGSDFEDDHTDFEDSEDDWQPQKNKSKKTKSSLLTGKVKRFAKGGKKRGTNTRKQTGKRAKLQDSSSEESDDSFDNKLYDDDDDDDLDEEEEDEFVPSVSKQKSTAAPKPKKKIEPTAAADEEMEMDMNVVAVPMPLQRKCITSSLKSFPDKNGVLTLHAFKEDVKSGFKDKKNLCLWRRDGTSLLQKFVRDQKDDGLIFAPTMVFSCWEDKRSEEYTEVKVQFVDINSKKGKVRILDQNEVTKASAEQSNVANDENDEMGNDEDIEEDEAEDEPKQETAEEESEEEE